MTFGFDWRRYHAGATTRKQRDYRTFAFLAATAGRGGYGIQHTRDAEHLERELLRERLPLWAASQSARPEEDV